MKRKAHGEAMDSDGEGATKSGSELLPSLDPSDDMCEALMRRYGKSASTQHRHLCASAAAMRSILLEEGLPLSPPAYLAAAVHSLRSTGGDPSATSAIASFLSILLPLIQDGELSTTKAKDTISILAGFLKENKALPTGTVRSIVRVLGLLVLFAEKADWEALVLPLDTLLAFSVDKRPKVRKCAQEFVEKIFTFLKGAVTIKKAEKAILDIFYKHIPSVKKLNLAKPVDPSKSKRTENTDEAELVHFLNLLILVTPHLLKNSRRKCFSEAFNLLTPEFYVLTRHTLKLTEALLKHLDLEYLSGESENFICSLMAYVSMEKNPTDTVVIALELLKDGLKKLKDIKPDMWSSSLPPVFEVATGYITSDVESSKEIGSTLKELIACHIDGRPFLNSENQIVDHEMDMSIEAIAIKSICSSLYRALSKQPTENVLGVISVLLLKLDESSCFFMKDIVLKLSEQVAELEKEVPILKNVQECIGCAVIAMGPEKIISLIPINLNEDKPISSNTWLIPILNKYTLGASLRCFMDHIVPLADSVKKMCKKGKKGSKQRFVQSWTNGLWGLLPAFCRYPSDIKESFGSLVELLTERLKQESSLHEIISKALQELINRNNTLCSGNQEGNVLAELMTSLSLQQYHFDFTKKVYSEKSARKNLKVLASHSMELISTFSDIFFDSSVEKRAYLKDTLRCLASVSESVNICTFYLSLVKSLDLADTDMENRNVKDQDTGTDEKEVEKDNSNEKQDTKRSLMLELASTFVEVANPDLLNIVFDFIRTSLMSDAEICHGQAFFAMSCILKEKSDFSLSRVDEIMLLLHNVESSSDNTTIVNRLSCYQHLLVHLLKVFNGFQSICSDLTFRKQKLSNYLGGKVNEGNMNNKAFLILNEIILAMKSKNESRSLAYDVLLATSSSLKSNAQSDLQRLFTMVMGYLSSPSPQITSGAVSALSLLIYNDAEFCLGVPNLIPSVLILLQNKSKEVIKAALGFVKVLVSTLQTDKLIKLQGEILKGILPWSAVSKFHFREKAGMIIEILIRKCGFGSVDMAVPQKYKGFVKTIAEARQNKKNPKEGDDDSNKAPESEQSSPNERAKKANTDNVSGSERRKGFGSKGSANRNWKIKKHNLKNTSENSVKSGKGNLKFQPQAESKAGEAKKRKRNVGSEQQSYNKKQKEFRKTKLDNSSDNKQRSFRKNKKNTPTK